MQFIYAKCECERHHSANTLTRITISLTTLAIPFTLTYTCQVTITKKGRKNTAANSEVLGDKKRDEDWTKDGANGETNNKQKKKRDVRPHWCSAKAGRTDKSLQGQVCFRLPP